MAILIFEGTTSSKDPRRSCNNIIVTMSQDNNVVVVVESNNNKANDEDDDHEHDMVMPGFRFHPTEEELVEFYLRRKVEGKRFNVELITFLDLYRYDPWELPALAAIGEKEWFFYVPRDRKYRNGDRPNRVTSSGYWKATGADRMIRTENHRSIGLKKTLVFYSGKAPKGIRTSWIMNEYRLPQHETERYQKAEISLCRVYKRAGVEDPRSVQTRASSSRSATQPSASSSEKKPANNNSTAMEMRLHQGFGVDQPPLPLLPPPPPPHQPRLDQPSETTDGSNSPYSEVATTAVLGSSAPIKRKAAHQHPTDPIATISHASEAADPHRIMLPNSNCLTFFTGSYGSYNSNNNNNDDLHRLVNNNHQQLAPSPHYHHYQQQQQYYNQFYTFPTPPSQSSSASSSAAAPPPPPLSNNMLLPNFLPTTVSDRLWDWNPFPDQPNRDHYSNFK